MCNDIIGTTWVTGAKAVLAATDAHGRRIGGGELGMGRLEIAQLPQEPVVLGVGDLRCVLLVVRRGMAIELGPQGVDAAAVGDGGRLVGHRGDPTNARRQPPQGAQRRWADPSRVWNRWPPCSRIAP
ncbi:MAG: hypothetical protein R2695_01945 [Acidimicrobiales bacterium]